MPIKRTPIIDVNGKRIIKEWSKKNPIRLDALTQKDLERFFNSRKGWKIIKTLSSIHRDDYGIFIHSQYRNGLEISIIAGEGLYSSPRKKAEEYNSVEIAIFKGDNWITSTFEKTDGEHVQGWMNIKELIRIINQIERR
jgi:hypothetical protein